MEKSYRMLIVLKSVIGETSTVCHLHLFISHFEDKTYYIISIVPWQPSLCYRHWLQIVNWLRFLTWTSGTFLTPDNTGKLVPALKADGAGGDPVDGSLSGRLGLRPWERLGSVELCCFLLDWSHFQRLSAETTCPGERIEVKPGHEGILSRVVQMRGQWWDVDICPWSRRKLHLDTTSWTQFESKVS